MRIRKIVILGVLAVALAIPGASLAKKHGIGKGGLPALRDFIFKELHKLDRRLDTIEALLGAQFEDKDGDGFYVFVPDCDDSNDQVDIDCP